MTKVFGETKVTVVNPETWKIDLGSSVIVRDEVTARRFLHSIGIQELDFAMGIAKDNGHNTMRFGMHGRFIFSDTQEAAV